MIFADCHEDVLIFFYALQDENAGKGVAAIFY